MTDLQICTHKQGSKKVAPDVFLLIIIVHAVTIQAHDYYVLLSTVLVLKLHQQSCPT